MMNNLRAGCKWIICLYVLFSSLQTEAQLSSLPPLPWPTTDPITISFAPDNVEIGRFRNELSLHLDSQLGNPDWKIEILRAVQTWARYSDVQYAVIPDSRRAFGVPGLSQSDPRFGDVRLGAFPQEEVLGNAVFYHPSVGTWAGDIFLDTNREFYIHDWDGGDPDPDRFDLFSVLLHEVGNTLGLTDDEFNPESVMFFAYLGPRFDLSQVDIDRIQMLYGPPSEDPFELTGNNDDFASATPIAFPGDFATTLQAGTFGRIQQSDDVDIYRFEGTSLAENCWLKLRCKGNSLLCSRITAYDAQFNEIATNQAESPLQNNVYKEITNIEPGETIYVAVQWSDVPDFDFGDYQLVLDFNANAGDEAAADEEGDDDDDDQNPFFEAGDDELVDMLYELLGLVDDETNTNNTLNTAVQLFSPMGTPAGSRFEIISAISAASDRDMYRIETSATATGTMVIDIAPLGLEPAFYDVTVTSSNRDPISLSRDFRNTGDLKVVVRNVQPNSTYYVRVQNRTGNAEHGNYLMLINVADGSGQLGHIQQVLLDNANPDQFGTFTTFKTQLFLFEMSMQSVDINNQACQLTIYSDSGQVELVTSARPGHDSVAFAWLQAGEHYVRFTAQTQNGAAIAASIVDLEGASISDDEGPVLIDISGNPISGSQTPGNNPTPPPTWNFPATLTILFDLVVPPENPWF